MTKLNLTNVALPQYTTTLPISKIVMKFRPFVVREEKVLLMALQSKNVNQINDAIRNTILACTNNVVDTKRLSTADAEYAFLQIRCKSVGEEVKPQVICSKCESATNIKINLDTITISEKDKEKIDPAVKITDDVTMIFRYPSIHDMDYSKSEVEIAFELAKKCVESIVINDQVYNIQDVNKEEIHSFIDNMLPQSFAKILDFFESVPELKYEFKYKCPSCSEMVNVQLNSVSDFFL